MTRESNFARWFPPAFISLCTLIVFARALGCDFVHDDWSILVNNTHLNPPTWKALGYYWSHVSVNLYIPVTCMVWELLAHAAYLPVADPAGNHLNPSVFHVAQILIHAGSAVALYRVLLHMVNKRWAAAAGALLFALHPIQVEAATFIGALNNPLMGLFSFLALGDYLEAEAIGDVSINKKAIYFRGMFFLLLAMLSKPTAVVIPPIAFLLDLVRGKRLRAAAVSIAPYAALIIPCLCWTHLFQTGVVSREMTPGWFRPIVALDSISFYVGKILVPFHFCEDYGRTPHLLFMHPELAGRGIVALLLLVLGLGMFRRFPLFAGVLLIFIVALLPNSGIVPFDNQQYSSVADRYAYLPMMAPALLVAWILCVPVVAKHFVIARSIVVLILLTLSADTFAQIGYWRNDETLFTHTVQVNPNTAMGFEGLAFGLLRSNPAGAIAAANHSLRLKPDYAAPHLTIASADFILGNQANGIVQLRESISLDPYQIVPHKLLATALSEMGQTQAALEEYRICLTLDPQDAAVHSDLAALFAESGRLREAIAEYHRALAINGNLDSAVRGLATAEQQLRKETVENGARP